MVCNDIGDDGMSLVVDGLQYNNSLTKLNVQHCLLSVKGTVVASYIKQSSNFFIYYSNVFVHITFRSDTMAIIKWEELKWSSHIICTLDRSLLAPLNCSDFRELL